MMVPQRERLFATVMRDLCRRAQDKILRSANWFDDWALKYRRLDPDHFPGLEGHRKLASHEVAGRRTKISYVPQGTLDSLPSQLFRRPFRTGCFRASSRHIVPG